jgi:hypothetical protein
MKEEIATTASFTSESVSPQVPVDYKSLRCQSRHLTTQPSVGDYLQPGVPRFPFIYFTSDLNVWILWKWVAWEHIFESQFTF